MQAGKALLLRRLIDPEIFMPHTPQLKLTHSQNVVREAAAPKRESAILSMVKGPRSGPRRDGRGLGCSI